MSFVDVSSSSLSSIGLAPNPINAGATLLITVNVKDLTSYAVTASASNWSGTGPYTQTLAVDSSVEADGEYLIFVDATATLEQRAAEYAAVITASVPSDGRVVLTAHGTAPTVDLPLRITNGAMDEATVSVPVSSWSGTGPWTASVDLSESADVILAGPCSESSAEQVEQIHSCGVHAAGVSGAVLTLRAMFAEPTTALVLGVAYL